jgi:hypothetical protein
MTAPINLTAGLKDVSAKGRTGEKMAIQIESDDLMFDPSDKVMSAEVAQAICDEIQALLLQGRRPDGSALPAPSKSTLERRELEVAQGRRGGEADERYQDGAFRTKVKRNYQRDYTTAKGKSYVPTQADGPRGVVSGMLAKSFFPRANRDGKGVTIYVAAKRGKPRKGESVSALQTVYGANPELLSAQLMRSPRVRGAIKKSLDSMLSKSVSGLLKNIADSVSALNDIGEAAGDAAEE